MATTRDRTVAGMRADGQVPVDTNELRSSIVGDPAIRSTATSATAIIKAPVIQAPTTDKGARPHPIYPRRPGGKLVFFWAKAGRVVAFPRVNHPGNRPMRWWLPTVHRNFQRAIRSAARSTPFP